MLSRESFRCHRRFLVKSIDVLADREHGVGSAKVGNPDTRQGDPVIPTLVHSGHAFGPLNLRGFGPHPVNDFPTADGHGANETGPWYAVSRPD